MKNLGVILFYASVVIVGVFMFLSIRWFVLDGNPVFYESTNKRVMTPDEVKSAGMAYEADKRYYQVEIKKTFLKSGKFPLVEKEVSLSSEFEILPDTSK